MQVNRRQFIKTSVLATAALAAAGPIFAETGVKWPIGCLNRPWMKSPKMNESYDTTLDGIKAAGYTNTGLLTPTEAEPFIAASAPPGHMDELKAKLAKRGLKPVMAALRTKPNLPLKEQITQMRTQIDNAKKVGVEFVLTFGADKPENYEDYYRLMQDAAPYAEERKLKLVLKPHGGASGAAEEISRCIEKVNHPNFKIWFDAGNIVFYTGKDPVEELKSIAKHVTGFCAKDCDKQRGDVWIALGSGTANLKGVFSELKKVGFNGPVMVECCAAATTADAMTANARAAREYLEKLFATL